MSHNKSVNNVDIKIVYLIHGWVSLLKIESKIIPTSTIDLIIKFYNCTAKIIYIAPTSTAPIICIAELNVI